ncbi:MAG: molybdopterin converting factor subunit 1 [Betaproteobacteria bacterium]|nr:molybdopterin converting factor subunit 1 [Betaproteobacteria bacterium]
MRVRLLYFASIREQLGCAAESLELPAGITTVGALLEHLMLRGGAWREALAQTRVLRVAINQDMAEPGRTLSGGDEVAFFPPVTGG